MTVHTVKTPELIDVDPGDPGFSPRSGGRVRLLPYRIAKYPVTNEEYAVFVHATASVAHPASWHGDAPASDEKRHPVWGVSASDAEAYCRWLSNLTDSTFRLPQEAEWEYAAGGRDLRLYPWGDDFDASRCNCVESGVGRTTPVDAHPDGVSAMGCFDMGGNVAEYCADIFRVPGSPTASGGIDADGALSRVIRGGWFSSAREETRCAARLPSGGGERIVAGFRVCSS
ncbi:formylglycine-generating enzyme family protein [Stackebrandtia endophytica]|nr:SUMF1/EgtB/PvdO family nonheme iron enzyme [Stackebrandtia endophytica]